MVQCTIAGGRTKEERFFVFVHKNMAAMTSLENHLYKQCSILHLNHMEIPGTKRFIPKGFGLDTKLC